MLLDSNQMPTTNEKALALALLAKAQRSNEIPPSSNQIIQSAGLSGVPLTPRSLVHRFSIGPSTNGTITELIKSTTAKTTGVTDFDKMKPAEEGFYCLTHFSIATTAHVGAAADTDIAVANFDRRIKADDAFLQGSILSVKVSGNKQPTLKIRLGDVMIGASDAKSGDYKFQLPEGIYINANQTVEMQLETPNGNNGVPASNFKLVEVAFHGMYASV